MKKNFLGWKTEFQKIGHISSQEEEKHSSSLDFSGSTYEIDSEIELR